MAATHVYLEPLCWCPDCLDPFFPSVVKKHWRPVKFNAWHLVERLEQPNATLVTIPLCWPVSHFCQPRGVTYTLKRTHLLPELVNNSVRIHTEGISQSLSISCVNFWLTLVCQRGHQKYFLLTTPITVPKLIVINLTSSLINMLGVDKKCFLINIHITSFIRGRL